MVVLDGARPLVSEITIGLYSVVPARVRNNAERGTRDLSPPVKAGKAYMAIVNSVGET